MKASEYADAIANLSAKGESDAKVAGGILHALRARGELKLLPSLARELRTRAMRASALDAHVEVAHEKDKASALSQAKEAGIDASSALVNASLISGWRAYDASKLVDRSGKRALVELYRAATR